MPNPESFTDALVQWAHQLLNAQNQAVPGPPLTELLRSWLERGDETAIRWQTLQRRAELTEGELVVLALLVAESEDFDFAAMLRESWHDPEVRALPPGFAARMANRVPGVSMRTSKLLDGRLMKSGLVSLQRGGHPLSSSVLIALRPILLYLAGVGTGAAELESAEEMPLPPSRLKAVMSRNLGPQLNEGPVRFALLGPAHTGGRELAAQLGLAVGVNQKLIRLRLKDSNVVTRLFPIALVTGALLVVDGYGITFDDEGINQEFQALWSLLERFPAVPVVFLGPPELARHLTSLNSSRVLQLHYPLRRERRQAWELTLEGLEQTAKPELLDKLAGSYLLSEPQIDRAAKAAALSIADGGPTEDALIEACRVEARTGIGALAVPESGGGRLADLVLNPTIETLLAELRAFAGHRSRFTSNWGFEEQHSYGLGLTALFTGPPGTGKTMAARALGTELGLEVFRVETSQLVSKYIGETEKHLGQLFDAAERGGIILLFDEADSLFSKRTDIKSSTDRYANLETNYLLQRMERFDGIVILTTNHESALDDAFVRRIRFRIRFDEPDAVQRQRLWKALIPGKVPLADDVDFEDLAEQYELTGGHIKEVILRASSLAYERGEHVRQQDFIRAADAEYRKMGKLALLSGLSNTESLEPIDDESTGDS